MPIDVVVFDQNHRYLFVNKTAIKDDKVRQWIIGKNDYEYCEYRGRPMSIAEERGKAFQRIKRTGKMEIVEESLLQPDGGVLHFLRYMFPMFDKESGELTHVFGYAHNITELKQQQAEQESQNEELRKVNTELDRFVYSASHDLRSPVASALGLIELIKLQTDIGEIMHYTEMQKVNLQRLDCFIKDILTHSRNAKVELAKEEVDLELLARDSFASSKNEAKDGEVRLIVESNAPVTLISDKYRLGIIFNNLISNAVRYINPYVDDHWIKVRIKVDKLSAHVEVEDNGIGVKEEFQSRIFEMFFRAYEKKTGSGLGLYIVQEALEKLSGSISVKSEPNEGTVFSFQVPNLVAETVDETVAQ
jgi:signal transduction histidine kinase